MGFLKRYNQVPAIIDQSTIRVRIEFTMRIFQEFRMSTTEFASISIMRTLRLWASNNSFLRLQSSTTKELMIPMLRENPEFFLSTVAVLK